MRRAAEIHLPNLPALLTDSIRSPGFRPAPIVAGRGRGQSVSERCSLGSVRIRALTISHDVRSPQLVALSSPPVAFTSKVLPRPRRTAHGRALPVLVCCPGLLYDRVEIPRRSRGCHVNAVLHGKKVFLDRDTVGMLVLATECVILHVVRGRVPVHSHPCAEVGE